MKYNETHEERMKRIRQSLDRINNLISELDSPQPFAGLKLVYSKPRTVLESLRANIERSKAKEARLKRERAKNNNNVIGGIS